MMKKYVICISLLIPAILHPCFKRPKPPLTTHTLTTPNFQTSISPLQVNTNGTLVISTPGDYYITDDIEFHPTLNPLSPIVIQISASNVTLNLNAKQIAQATTNTTSLVRGIVVDAGLSNIFIHNGSLHNFSGAGIVIGANCKNVTLYKISITQCDLGGIYLGYNPFDTGTYPTVYDGQEQIRFTDPSNPTTNVTEDVLLESVYVSDCSGYFSGSSTNYAHAIGIQIADVRNFQLQNTISNSNRYSAPTLIKNSTTNPGGYYSASRSGYIGCGIHIIRSKNGYIEQTEASNNTGWAAYGFLIENCTCVDFQNCFANVNVAEGDPVQHATLLPSTFDYLQHRDIGRATGYALHDSSCNHFVCCQANDTHGTRQAAGFWFRRYHLISSASPFPNTNISYFDPTLAPSEINTACTGTGSTASLELEQAFILPPIPSTSPAIGTGYTVTTGAVYLLDAGSNWNHCIDCQVTHSHSDYTDAYGFLSQGGVSNWLEKCIAQSCMSGSGVTSYSPSELANFDLSSGIWSLIDAPQYNSPHTNVIIQFAAGMAFEALRLPLMSYSATTKRIELQTSGSNIIFLGMKIKDILPSSTQYALPYWSDSCPNIYESHSKDNMGSCVGTGVGILLNGVSKGILKNNWVSCNHSCTTGTTGTPCSSGSASNIGAQGGYGILDVWTNCTSLILDNKAFGNQIIRPLVATCLGCQTSTTGSVGLGAYIEGSNYHTVYADPNLSLPIEAASIGDFSPFNILTPLSNFEWNTANHNPSYKLLNRILITSASFPSVFTI